MRLMLYREQKTVGVLNKATQFQLTIRMVLDECEQRILVEYKLGRELIYNRKDTPSILQAKRNAWGGSTRNPTMAAINMQLTATSLLKGRKIKSKSFTEICDIEASITQSCKAFKRLLKACPAFKGELVVEI